MKKVMVVVYVFFYFLVVAGTSYGHRIHDMPEVKLDTNEYRTFSFNELVDFLEDIAKNKSDLYINNIYQWLMRMRINKKKIHRAAATVYNNMDSSEKSESTSKEDCHMYAKGKRLMMLFLAFCSSNDDGASFVAIYSNPTENLEVRTAAMFAHLLSVDNDGIPAVIDGIYGNISELRGNHKSSIYYNINLAARWVMPEKRKIIIDALKKGCMQEDSKFMFVKLDSYFKCHDNTYAKSQFRRDFIQHFLETPFNENEINGKVNEYFDEAMNECFNEDAEVKPLRYVPRTYGPFISYEESILGITPQQRRIRTMITVTTLAAIASAMVAVVVLLIAKRNHNR